MNASERKVLALLHERAVSGPWTTTHADAALACGLQERSWRRAVSTLVDVGCLSVFRTKHGVQLSVKNGHSELSSTDMNGHGRTRTDKNGQSSTDTRSRAVSSFVVDDVSKEETTTSATTTVVEQTARKANVRSRTDKNGQERTVFNGHERTLAPNARAELLDLYRLALDQAEELGRVKAERDALRLALGAHTEAPCPTPARSLPRSTPAPPAATPVNATTSPATGPTLAPRSSSTSCGSTSTPTAIGIVPGSDPIRSAPSSPRPAEAPPSATQLANSRAPVPLWPEPVDVDRDEDVRAFREIVSSPHASELEVEAQVARALSYGVRLHQAVASVAIAQASGSTLAAPDRFAWAVINGKTLPSPGSSKTWAELRSTVLPALCAEAARKAAGKAVRGDSGGAHRVEHVSRPIQLNPVQQRQQEVRARQAARYLEDAKRALARQTAGGSP